MHAELKKNMKQKINNMYYSELSKNKHMKLF